MGLFSLYQICTSQTTIMDGPLFFLRGVGGQLIPKTTSCTAKATEKNKQTNKQSCKGSHGGNIDQVLSFRSGFFMFKKFFHNLVTTKSIMRNLKVRIKFHAPENCPSPPPSLKKEYSVLYGDRHV